MKTRKAIKRQLLILPALLLVCASVGVWHAQERRSGSRANERVEVASLSVKRFKSETVYGSRGALQFENLRLTGMSTSAVLKGQLINKTKRPLDEVTFEVRAYDHDGQLLKGIEEKTIFIAHQLKPRASTALNSGYGVWLQGIPPDAVSTIEISETSDDSATSFPIQVIPFASHAVTWKEDSEIEE